MIENAFSDLNPFLSDPVMHLATQLLLKTGKVDSINMKNGSVIPVSGSGAPAGAAMSAVNSLKVSAEEETDYEVGAYCMNCMLMCEEC